MIDPSSEQSKPWKVFLIFLRLGLTSFGGPVAHLGYFREEFVSRRAWITDKNYSDLIALCQFLPGPASSQVGFALGLCRGGYSGALAAWLGFTLPSAIVLILFALGISGNSFSLDPGAIQGLKLVAVAVVAQAVWGMGKNFCTDLPRLCLMAAACAAMLLASSVIGQVGVIVLAGLVGMGLFKPSMASEHEQLPIKLNHRTAGIFLALFVILLVGLPIVSRTSASEIIAIIDAFYRSGALVFGGGHVVLPLLQAEVVPPNWINNEIFLAGYGATQAVPGPLFTFAAFLGAAMQSGPGGWIGAIISLVAIFAPSFLLVLGCLPFWESLRQNQKMQAALIGINAAVVGLLLAALYNPVWTSTIGQPQDILLAVLALIALMVWKLPPWLVVLASGVLGWILSLVF
jgi:chromate transporter